MASFCGLVKVCDDEGCNVVPEGSTACSDDASLRGEERSVTGSVTGRDQDERTQAARAFPSAGHHSKRQLVSGDIPAAELASSAASEDQHQAYLLRTGTTQSPGLQCKRVSWKPPAVAMEHIKGGELRKALERLREAQILCPVSKKNAHGKIAKYISHVEQCLLADT
ncbi:hypothetical protein WJX72_003038 [[Myrmecia] bisecta]|uniref:Uncharacterized protein n=1 Tax=[Myrmecia] bisecta TaxID=41462 RepID=A0AAW1PN80_9CHLO